MENILDNINTPNDIKNLNKKELNQLSSEIRRMIISTVSQNGGHLASNLGIVEATIAIHKVFNLAHDRVVFDVGHQCYTHKILTERKELFKNRRETLIC